ncbi:T9SS type A sorting domain-containing protein [Psychroserpens jangbogonensis]|uniref:T9SS type A sorting domain-containing protein n=1 Tax=Psychroserpens jangbogonensis TaxID=1484460 RepID=UPI00053EFF23|nr:T9SS type A sorting domain-containing protein [Psychroserpens jangbogonensis]
MKHIYLSILFLFSVCVTNSQNELLLGEWYLISITSDGVQNDNFIGEVQLNFTNIESEIADYYIADGGSSCEFQTMSYLPLSNDTLRIIDLTSSGSCDFSTVAGIYTNLYNDVITNSFSVESDLNYQIIGSGDNEQLTLQNSSGDFVVFGRTPNNALLTRTWYLSRIEIPGNPTIEVFTIENPSLTLTNDINPLTFRTTAFGEGECNAFMSDYEVTLNNGNNIHLLDFSPTLGFCESDYESEYFNIIGFPPNNFSEFEIINNGTTLNVTDLLGARLVFGDEPLSISENEINALQITLKNNPVSSEINLSVSRSGSELNYQIYSIDGKLVKEAKLRSESINVYDLNSGLYFIRFFNNSNQLQTLKFIKQ